MISQNWASNISSTQRLQQMTAQEGSKSARLAICHAHSSHDFNMPLETGILYQTQSHIPGLQASAETTLTSRAHMILQMLWALGCLTSG